jgi:hypothetical protein
MIRVSLRLHLNTLKKHWVYKIIVVSLFCNGFDEVSDNDYIDNPKDLPVKHCPR